MSAFNFENPNAEEELKKWLLDRLPQVVTLTDHIWKILGDPEGGSAEEKNAKLVDMAAAFVKSGGSCFPGSQLDETQLARFQKLIPGLIAIASITVKGPLVPHQSTEDQLMNKNEAAAYLKISVRKLEKEAAKNYIVRIKHGKGRTAKVQFKKSDLDTYLENNTVHMRRAGRSAK